MNAQMHRSITPPLQRSTETEMPDVRLINALQAIPGLTLKTDEPLAPFTTMKIGGSADYFLEVGDEAALSRLLPLLQEDGVPICLLGNGSNVLISDRGVRGAVIHLTGHFKKVTWGHLELDEGGDQPLTVLLNWRSVLTQTGR